MTTRVASRLLSSEPNLAWLLQNYCALQVLLLRLPRSGSGQSATFHWPVKRYGSKRDISEPAVNRQHAWNRNPGRPAIQHFASTVPLSEIASTRTARQLWDRRKPRSGSHSSVLHTLEDQFERLSICGINTCGVDPSPLQSLEAKTKTCILSILRLYFKMLICGIYPEI